MKKVVLSFTLLLLFTNAFSQDTTLPALTSADYLKKSKSQKSAGWAMLGVGVASLAGAAATFEISIGGYGGHAYNTGSAVLGVIGAGSLLTSAALFISSGQNRRKAASLALIHQPIQLPAHLPQVARTQPALQLRISL